MVAAIGLGLLLAFAQQVGHFWGIVSTRPYMRARLRLNPDDNQGVRYALLAALILAGRDDQTAALLEQFGDEDTALWHYGRALAVFRREGDSRGAREALREALRSNRHVPQYLTGDADWPGPLPDAYGPGSREEAAICDTELGEAWDASPGAISWLRAQAPARRSGKRRR